MVTKYVVWLPIHTSTIYNIFNSSFTNYKCCIHFSLVRLKRRPDEFFFCVGLFNQQNVRSKVQESRYQKTFNIIYITSIDNHLYSIRDLPEHSKQYKKSVAQTT